MKLFTKKERSTFPYWFAHWCAFQMIALLIRKWKPAYLLHDIEKPWLMKLWKGDYKKVQQYHRHHSNHHLEYLISHDPKKFDFLEMCIDWECCRFTKKNSPKTARQMFGNERDKLLKLLGGDKKRPEYKAFNTEVDKLLKLYF